MISKTIDPKKDNKRKKEAMKIVKPMANKCGVTNKELLAILDKMKKWN